MRTPSFNHRSLKLKVCFKNGDDWIRLLMWLWFHSTIADIVVAAAAWKILRSNHHRFFNENTTWCWPYVSIQLFVHMSIYFRGNCIIVHRKNICSQRCFKKIIKGNKRKIYKCVNKNARLLDWRLHLFELNVRTISACK